eukprot:CAMPEP_0203968984 /NCGR_PEP_ID=MMETSP0359-20131031/97229_1 /ASSEMBLY_ACC=CAM_ASM_000338 /TAXON_ID=268821 /ORGANISM="Scrippsiella Hangoei, Strain SHTV-5" /LENGTH=116 /DNA_ID=CAMNT_0050906919 /DNA_START=180 /DNA_END=527 /DNA_ORIENTATION=-
MSICTWKRDKVPFLRKRSAKRDQTRGACIDQRIAQQLFFFFGRSSSLMKPVAFRSMDGRFWIAGSVCSSIDTSVASPILTFFSTWASILDVVCPGERVHGAESYDGRPTPGSTWLE